MSESHKKNILKRAYHWIKDTIDPPPSKLSNFSHNKRIWDLYAKGWYKRKLDMKSIEDADVKEEKIQSYVEFLGDEWGRKVDVENIVADYIYPFITPESVVAEIGIGGARIASRVVGRVREFYGFDISTEMLKKAKDALGTPAHVRYVLLEQPSFPEELSEKFDFVYSFDVFVHLDLHTIWKYFGEIRGILKKNGKVFIHTANLKAPGGWEKFSSQKEYVVENHYFISPEIIDIFAQHSGLKMIKSSVVDPSNFYLNRDYLFVLEKV